jgi:isoleucyl-tRNA synthetase
MDASYEADQLLVFASLVERGLVARQLQPVYWSPSSKSALAEAELEYADADCLAAYVAFDTVSDRDGPSHDRLLIWTTTPWTLPANQAIAVNPAINYCRAKDQDGRPFIIAVNCCSKLNFTFIESIAIEDLLAVKYRQPFTGSVGSVVAGGFVDKETGTGLVHIAPAYGQDDFE